MGFFTAILGAGAALGSAFLKKKSDDKAADKAQSAVDAQRAQDIALQKEFAQNSIQWKVEDAKKAGLHPLAALGVSGYQYTSPGLASVGRSGLDLSSVGGALSNMGQSVDRAREVGMTRAQRQKAESFADASAALQLRHGQLQNEILELEVASKKARLSQESMPGTPLAVGPDGSLLIQGQGDSFMPASVNPVPASPRAAGILNLTRPDVVLNEPGRVSQVAGSNPDYSFQRLPGGAYAPTRIVNGQDPYEEDWLGGFSWNIRNRLVPALTGSRKTAPPKSWLPPGYTYWEFNIPKGAWVPGKKSDGLLRQFGRMWKPW